MSAVTTSGLPIALPSTGAVAAVCPEAVEVIDRFNRLESELPVRPSAEQINEMEALRSEAVGLLMDPAIQGNLEEVRRKRRREMRELIGELTRLWREEEAAVGLEQWRRNPTSFRPARGAGMPVTLSLGAGGAFKHQVGALTMLRALERLIRGA